MKDSFGRIQIGSSFKGTCRKKIYLKLRGSVKLVSFVKAISRARINPYVLLAYLSFDVFALINDDLMCS